MKMRVLITGGAGFVGHHTANKLADDGCEVRILDNLSKQVHINPTESISRLHPAIEFINADIRNHSKLQTALKDIDIIYHFAAETGVGQSMYEIERYSDVNIQGTAVLCDCIAKMKGCVKKVILSSSRAVYGEGPYRCESCGIVNPEARTLTQLKAGSWEPACPKCGYDITAIPCQETALCRPTSIYGMTKKVQEDLLSIFTNTYNLPVVILRYFNVFGAGQSVSNPYTGLLSIFSSLLLANKDIEIYEDGLMQRDFIPVRDVVIANAKALELDLSGVLVLNVGSGVKRTIIELAKYLKAKANSSSRIKFTSRYRVGDVRHCYADVSKACSYIEQSSKDSFEQQISDLIAWVKTHDRGLSMYDSIAELSHFGLSGIAKEF